MFGTLVVTSSLLACILLLRYVEIVYGKRVIERPRRWLDEITERSVTRVGRRCERVREFVNRETVVKILHMVTYLALVLVRIIERKLTASISHLRSFRKKKTPKAISPRLKKVARSLDSSKE